MSCPNVVRANAISDLPPVTDQLERLTAALADSYAVERELGAGGMAMVYLARDIKHDRLVAVKVFRPELAASIGAERFLREIQVTAKLSHPHILPLYDSGEADGFLYYIMPYVEGESLSDLLAREKQLPIHDAIRIAREVAEALGQAHSYGLVHRDVKPQNILLSGGHAVVADFGIARAVSVAGGEKLTQTGMAVGTPAYMSPEQAAGDESIDGRSDLYSLGCVLYEMLVGQVPFTGPTPQSIIARHTMDTAPPPKIMRQTIPDDLEDVIYCALAKAPADRFHTASEFVEALDAVVTGGSPRLPKTGIVRRRGHLRGWRRAASAAAGVVAFVGIVGAAWVGWRLLRGGSASDGVGGLDPQRIAVLYFEDLSPDHSLSYVTDGLTEEIIRRLKTVEALDVVSRNGAAQFRSGEVSRDSVARALEAGTLVEGSVVPVGDRLRVSTYLVEGTSGADFARANLDVPAGEFFALQDSVAGNIARLLRERLGEEIQLRERQASTASLAAWALVQRGERLRKDAETRLLAEDPDGAFAAFTRADSVLRDAEATDPTWIEPIVLRGQIAYRRSRLAPDLQETVQWIETGLGHAERALRLDGEYAEALELRGTLRYWHWLQGVIPDPVEVENLLDSARADLELAVQREPSLASAQNVLSHLYTQYGDMGSALRAARSAYRADAYLTAASDILARLFYISYDLEQLTDARRWCGEARRRFPEDFRFTECRLWEMTTPAVEPDVDEAWRLLEQLTALAPEPIREFRRRRGMMVVGGILARAGLVDSAGAVMVRARAGYDLDPVGELQFLEAYMRTLAGDLDEATARLEQYASTVDDPLDAIDPDYWWWRDLRDYPRFRQLVGEER